MYHRTVLSFAVALITLAAAASCGDESGTEPDGSNAMTAEQGSRDDCVGNYGGSYRTESDPVDPIDGEMDEAGLLTLEIPDRNDRTTFQGEGQVGRDNGRVTVPIDQFGRITIFSGVLDFNTCEIEGTWEDDLFEGTWSARLL